MSMEPVSRAKERIQAVLDAADPTALPEPADLRIVLAALTRAEQEVVNTRLSLEAEKKVARAAEQDAATARAERDGYVGELMTCRRLLQEGERERDQLRQERDEARAAQEEYRVEQVRWRDFAESMGDRAFVAEARLERAEAALREFIEDARLHRARYDEGLDEDSAEARALAYFATIPQASEGAGEQAPTTGHPAPPSESPQAEVPGNVARALGITPVGEEPGLD